MNALIRLAFIAALLAGTTACAVTGGRNASMRDFDYSYVAPTAATGGTPVFDTGLDGLQ